MDAIKKDITAYNIEHKINDYNDSYRDFDCGEEYSKYIHDNLHLMDYEEMKYHDSKIKSYNQLKKNLLGYELNFYHPEPEDLSLDEFTKKAIQTLQKYNILREHLEDEWDVVRSNQYSDLYSVKDNEVLFTNTIFKGNANDSTTLNYINKLVKRLNCISTTVKAKCNIEKDKHGICCVLIWCYT